MQLYIFARFHAQAGKEDEVESALTDVLEPSRAEAGCISINIFHSIQDSRLFYLHSQWSDRDAFEAHVALPHTIRFVERVQPLIDHPMEVARTELAG